MKTKAINTQITALSLVTFLTAAPIVQANTLVFWNDNDQAKVVARSMDLAVNESPQLRVSPRGITRIGDLHNGHLSWQAKYGSVALLGFQTNATTDGVNEAGLAVHSMALQKTNYGTRDGSRPTLSNAQWVQYMLDNFDTVEEALSSFEGYQITPTALQGNQIGLHLAIEDATGDSAIVEFIDGKPVIHHGKNIQVMTNQNAHAEYYANQDKYFASGASQNLPGDLDPDSRYARAFSYLKSLPAPENATDAVSGVASVIRTTMVPEGSGAWPTRWVTVSDLSNQIYYFSSVENKNTIWVDLKNVNLAPNAPVMYLTPTKPELLGDVSKSFTRG